MKNIHLIPTDKPSRLYKTGNFLLLDSKADSKAMPNNTLETKNQHIYITNDEEIKEEDWHIYENEAKKTTKETLDYIDSSGDEGFKKIILTTDQDLDSVQAIDDEFLEWFVKNPSCEEVETVFACRGFNGTIPNLIPIGEYKIIIPKEEQKQHLIDIMKGDEELGLYDEESKQETLEEAAENYAHNYFNMHETNNYKALKAGFEKGAKWQQEKMYSEEDLKSAFFNGGNMKNIEEFNYWLEQFKKK